jgi:hypothetical protein
MGQIPVFIDYQKHKFILYVHHFRLQKLLFGSQFLSNYITNDVDQNSKS